MHTADHLQTDCLIRPMTDYSFDTTGLRETGAGPHTFVGTNGPAMARDRPGSEHHRVGRKCIIMQGSLCEFRHYVVLVFSTLVQITTS